MSEFAKVLLSNLLIGSLAMTAATSVRAAEVQARTIRISTEVSAEHPISKGTKRFWRSFQPRAGGNWMSDPTILERSATTRKQSRPCKVGCRR